MRVEVANRIADALMQVGIECKVETLTYKEARDKLKAGSYDLCLAAFNIDFTPDPGYLLISGNNCNYMRYKSTEMDNLFKTLRAAQEEVDNADFTAFDDMIGELQRLEDELKKPDPQI